jgi:hypothetical protein
LHHHFFLLEFQDDSTNGSIILINPSIRASTQYQTSIESENSSNTHDESSPLPQFVNDSQQQSIDLLEQNLSQIIPPPPENIFSNDKLQDDQQSYDENASVFRYSESLTEESQVSHQFESPIQISYDEIMNKTAQNLVNNSENKRKALGNDIKNKPDFKNKSNYKSKPDSEKNIRNVLNSQKLYMNTQTGKDLVEYIPGLYRLLSKASDSGNSSILYS